MAMGLDKAKMSVSSVGYQGSFVRRAGCEWSPRRSGSVAIIKQSGRRDRGSSAVASGTRERKPAAA